MPNTDIEPATLRSLARRSDQLSYATALKSGAGVHDATRMSCKN